MVKEKKQAHETVYQKEYGDYLYTGLQGVVMRQNHKILSRGSDSSLNRKILEIGGGAKPHCSVVDLEGVHEYWLSDMTAVLTHFDENHPLKVDFKIKKHMFDNDPDYLDLIKSGHRFSRIIASHVWEHINDPEDILLKWVDLLEPNGQLDISIPCDPGWLWRLGQLVGRKKLKLTRSHGTINPEEYDLEMTREHVNSSQNLMRIMRYYSKARPRFFPFFIPVVDFNLFVFFRVKKSEMIAR